MPCGMISLMSITALSAPDFFYDESYFWNHPLARPAFLIDEPVDRLLEDEVPVDEVERAYREEAELRAM
jgi:hypothetical protein